MLRHVSTGRIARLATRTTVGRSPGCVLQLRGRRVSGEHAAITWTGEVWSVRDLGSRNGTWLDERKLEPGELAVLEVDGLLAFGDPDDRWRVEKVRPPTPFATALGDGAAVDAYGGVIALPSSSDPQVMVFATPDGWMAEDEGGARVVHDQAVLVADGQPWRLALPEVLEQTLTARGARPREGDAPGLRLRYSRDEEYVESAVWDGEGWVEVPFRAPHYMLVVLARERAADAEASPADRGWMHVERLAEAMGIGPRTVNVHVCRLRQQFGELGLVGLLERRPGTGQIRLGLERVDLGPL